MATVTSLTAERVLELAAQWEAVTQKQLEADSATAQLSAEVLAAQEVLAEFAGLTLPELETRLAANALSVETLVDTTLVDLDAALAANQEALNNMNVDVVNAGIDIESQYVVLQSLPHTFNQDTAPVDGDDEDRPLMVGDRWNDTSTIANTEYRWNGTEWANLQVDIPDLSITVKKFQTSTHMIY